MDNAGQHAAHERKVIHMLALSLTEAVRSIVQRWPSRAAKALAIALMGVLCNSLAARPAAAIDLLNIRSYAYKVIDNSKEFKCLDYIITKESHWNYKAANPNSSAYGIAQLLNERSKDPYEQLQRALRYVEHRYSGSWCRAKRHHLSKGWY